MEQADEQDFHADDANEATYEQASESYTPRAEADVDAGDANTGDEKRKSRKIKKAQRKTRSTSRTRLPQQESQSNLPEQRNDAETSAQTNTDENNAEEQILVAQPQAIVQPPDELVTQAVSAAENVEHSAAELAENVAVVVEDASVPQLVEDEKPDETAADEHDAQPQEENNAAVTDTTAVNESDQNGSEQVVRNSEDADKPAEVNEPATTSNTTNVYPHPPRAPRRSKSAKQRGAAPKPAQAQPENEEQQNEEEQASRRQRPGSAKGRRLVSAGTSAGREQRLVSKYGELHGLLTQEFLVNTDDLIERQVRETKQLLQNYISTQRIVAHSEARHHVMQDRHEDASEWPEGRHARAFREAQQAKVKVHVQTSTSDADEGNKRLLRRSQTQAQCISATTSKADQPASLGLESGNYPSTKPPLNRKNKENSRARTVSANEPDGANLLVGYGLEVEESKRSKRSDNYLGHTDNPVVLKWLRAKNKQLHNQRDSDLRQQREQMLLERFQEEQAEERKHAAKAAYKKWLHETNARQNTARARFECKLDLSSHDDADGDTTQLNSLRLEPFDDSNPHVLTSDEFSDEDEAVRDARIKARKVCHNYVFKHPLPPYRVKSGVSVSKCNTVRFKIRGQASSLQSSRPASTMPSTSRERTAIVSKSSISSETMALVRQAQRYSASGVIVTAKSRRPQSAAVMTGSNDAGDTATSHSSRVFRPMHPKLSFDEWLQRQQQQDSQRQELALRLQQRNAASESERHENGEPEVLLEQPQMTSHASNEGERNNGRGDDDGADLSSTETSAQAAPEVQDENESRADRPASPVQPPSIPLSDDEYYSDLPV